jgi:hypothetical protein
MNNVVKFADFQKPPDLPGIRSCDLSTEQLSKLPYDAVLDWAGWGGPTESIDFNRLVAVAKARDYHPRWISHQMEECGRAPTPEQAATLDRMIAEAGPYLSRRERWVLRHLRSTPRSESELVRLASKAAEFREYKHPDRCVANDIGKLVERNLIQTRGLVYYAISDAGGSGGAAQASTPPQRA